MNARKSLDFFPQGMRTTIAVEGCCHGDLDRIYEVLGEIQHRTSIEADFMICCGDFQAIRTAEELESLACPSVYRHLKDFHKYWRGDAIPRCLTLFVGGNHEAPGHLREMYFGGFASKDIFYLGASGVYRVNGVRIAGLSGIYKSHDLDKPIFEAPPYNENSKRSAYHVRRFEMNKLMQIQEPVDIVVSHDWPTGITDFGDTETLLRLKDKTGQLRSEINSGQLGNPHTMAILKKLKPKFWFAGHMHIKYSALYEHEDGSVTRFLALDKCIPRRPFLQLLSLDEDAELIQHSHVTPRSEPAQVCLDLEWLAILKKTNDFFPVPGNEGRGSPTPVTRGDIEAIRTMLKESKTNPKPVQTDDGEFLMPQFGQVFPGDDKYRRWICDVLEMRDRLGDTTRIAQIPIPAMTPAAAESSKGADGDILFFEDA
jgi:lariat debranching enzyme